MNILGTGIQRSGKDSAVVVDDFALAFAKWQATYRGDNLDTVNFESNGVDEGLIGVIASDFSFSGDWDAGGNPFDNPPGVYPREDLPNVQLYTNTTDNVFWEYPFARVLSATNGSEVRGKVTMEAACMNQGLFAAPTGSVAA